MENNQLVYHDRSVISTYVHQTLLSQSEIVLFLQYREHFFNKKVLEIGCGTGRVSRYLIPFCHQYVGIDYSMEMIRLSRKRFPEVDFRIGDVRDLSSFPEQCFDFIVFSLHGLDYISHADRLKSLKEIHRVLQDGGLFVFSTHNRDCIKKRKIATKPWLQRSVNPFRLFKNLIQYVESRKNYLKTLSNLAEEKEYAVLNDGVYDFKLTTYYIDLSNQVKQLNDNGFLCEAIYDDQGNHADRNGRDENTKGFYYVARKK